MIKLFITWTLFCLTAKAQEMPIIEDILLKDKSNLGFTAKWSPDLAEKSSYNENSSSSFETIAGDVYSFRFDYELNKLEISCFDKNMYRKGNAYMDIKSKNKHITELKEGEYSILGANLVNGVPSLVVFFKDSEENSYLKIIPLQTNCLVNLGKDALKSDGISVTKLLTKSEHPNPYVSFYASNNKKYSAINYKIKDKESELWDDVIIVYDSTFSEIKRYEKIEYLSFGALEPIIISNEGEIYAIAKKTIGETKKSKQYEYRIVYGGNELNVSDIIATNEIFTIKILNEIDGDVKVVKANYLVKNKDQVVINNIEVFNLSNEGIVNKSDIEINENILLSLGADKKKGLNNYTLKNVNNDNNNYYLVLEQDNYSSSSMSYGTLISSSFGGITSLGGHASSISYTNREVGNILVLKVKNKTNEILWTRLMERYQSFAANNFINYSSLFSFVANDKLVILTNDNGSNDKENERKEKVTTRLKASNLTAYYISETKNERYPLLIGSNEDCMVKVLSSSVTNENNILLYGNAIAAMGKVTGKSKYGILRIEKINLSEKTE